MLIRGFTFLFSTPQRQCTYSPTAPLNSIWKFKDFQLFYSWNLAAHIPYKYIHFAFSPFQVRNCSELPYFWKILFNQNDIFKTNKFVRLLHVSIEGILLFLA